MSIDDMRRDDANDMALFSQDDSAKQINRLHAEANAHAETAVKKAIQCGAKLAAKKESLPHGEWLPWVEKHLTFSDRTARIYMQVAANRQSSANLDSLNEAVKLLAEPREPTNNSATAPEAGAYADDSKSGVLTDVAKQEKVDQEAREKKLKADLATSEKALRAAKEKLASLEKLRADKEKIEKALKGIHELEKKKQGLFKDAESTQLVQQVLVRSREFFTRECMQIPALKLRPESVKVMKQDFEGLIELVENWLEAMKERFL